jgi:hypothetical protein
MNTKTLRVLKTTDNQYLGLVMNIDMDDKPASFVFGDEVFTWVKWEISSKTHTISSPNYIVIAEEIT